MGSRPPSPANEANEECATPTDESNITQEERVKIEAAQCRRKSSAWKGFNLKRRLSKVNLRLTNTFGDGSGSSGTGKKTRSASIFYHGPTDGTKLSPVEISPESIESSITPDETEDKSDYLADLEKNIVQSLSDIESKTPSEHNPDSSVDNTASNSDQESEPVSLSDVQPQISTTYGQSVPRSILQNFDARCATGDSGGSSATVTEEGARRRTLCQLSQPQSLLQGKRVDFSEDIIVKSLGTQLEGAHLSRPSDLPLFDDDGNPIATLRSMKKVKRNRMLSVPNIKLNRLDTVKLRDLRARSQKDQASSFAGSLIRRFSKY